MLTQEKPSQVYDQGVRVIVRTNDHHPMHGRRQGTRRGAWIIAKRIYQIDLTGVIEVSALTGSKADQTAVLAAKGGKTQFLDIVAELTARLLDRLGRFAELSPAGYSRAGNFGADAGELRGDGVGCGKKDRTS